MPDEQKTQLRLEIAHVLFMDIVGYSKLLIDEQSEALQELNEIVRKTDAVRVAEAAGQLIILPTGDGMALVFTGSVEDPVECALQISQRLRAQPSLPVRMGIHSGPVHHVADVNQRENIAGAGINIAQRVMVLCAFAERDPAGLENALRALGSNAWGDNATRLSVPLGEALLARLRHDEEKARAAFTRAREKQQKLVQADPNFAPPICILGLIDAGLGRKKEALEEAQHALDLMPVTKDMSNGTDMLQYSAIVAAWAGEKDLACERLSAAVSHPSVLSYGRLKLLPWWDPLRGDSRFEKIVASLALKE